MGTVIIVQRRADLLEVVAALRAAGCLAGCLHSRKQKRDQDANDGNHHQKFHQRKTAHEGLAVPPAANRLGRRPEPQKSAATMHRWVGCGHIDPLSVQTIAPVGRLLSLTTAPSTRLSTEANLDKPHPNRLAHGLSQRSASDFSAINDCAKKTAACCASRLPLELRIFKVTKSPSRLSRVACHRGGTGPLRPTDPWWPARESS